MVASSLFFLRSIAFASSHRSLFPGAFLARPVPAEGPNLRRSNVLLRPFSGQALESSDIAEKSRSPRQKKSPTSSWEEAGEAFFRRKVKNGADDGSLKEQRNEIKSVPDSFSAHTKSNRFAENEPVKGRFERRRASSESKPRYFREAPGESDSGKDGFRSRNGGYASREGRGTYRGRSFREEFSEVGDDNRGDRRNPRNGFDTRNRSSARSEFGSRRFRDEDDDETHPARGNGAYRREFGDSVDTSKSLLRKGRQGGIAGKKLFPDVDGGKRMFKGRFEGDGFANDARQVNGRDGGNRGLKTHGVAKRGQPFPKRGIRAQGKFEKGQELSEALSEDDEDEDEDEDDAEDDEIPQAGSVIRFREMGKMSENNKRMQLSHDVGDPEGDLHDETQMESDEDDYGNDTMHKGRNLGSFRKDQPVVHSSLPKLAGEIVYGVGPVRAALQVCRRVFYCLYVQQNMPLGGGSSGKKENKKAIEWIIRTAIDKGLEVREITKHDLNTLSDNRPHQGVILDASPLELVVSTHLEPPLTEDGKTPVWVALDEVMDPQNFGAILRSAYFLGAEGVIVCAKNSAPLSAVVSKASAGALEVMELRSCKNMMKFLDWSAENGWRVVGGSAAEKGVIYVSNLPRGLPTILVLGGEGKGLRTNVKRSCSELVCIPGFTLESKVIRGSALEKQEGSVDVDSEDKRHQLTLQDAHKHFTAVESLNVSVAAGILLHELLNNESAKINVSHDHSEANVEGVEDNEETQLSRGVVEEMCDNEREHHGINEEEALPNEEHEQDAEIIIDEVLIKAEVKVCESTVNL